MTTNYSRLHEKPQRDWGSTINYFVTVVAACLGLGICAIIMFLAVAYVIVVR